MIRFLTFPVIILASLVGCSEGDGASNGHYLNERTGPASGVYPKHVKVRIPQGFSEIPAGDIGPREAVIRFGRNFSNNSGIEIEIFSKKHAIPKFSNAMEEIAWLDSEPWAVVQSHMYALNAQRRQDSRIKVHKFNWNRRELPHPRGTPSQKVVCSDAYADIEDVRGKPILFHTRSLSLYCSIFWKEGREIDREKGLVLIQVSVMDGWIPSRKGRPTPDFETVALGVMRSVEIVP